MRIEIDRLVDGEVDSIVDRLYDGASNIIREAEDDDADGVPDRITTRTYDHNGNLVERALDRNNDGYPDSVTRITYDKAGRALLAQTDDNVDGQADWLVRYTYNSSGEMASESIDYEGDGEPDLVLVSMYATGHRLAAVAVHSGPDLHMESLATNLWNYEDLLGYYLVHFDIPELSTSAKYFYDEDGRLTRLEEYGGVDGLIDTLLTYTYNDTGWLSTRTRERGSALQRRSEYTYDSFGRLIEQLDIDHVVGATTYAFRNRCP